ncbi:unnamed protein product [Blepharisma stoltei]|uniref:Uncharacterized protein n=1 Tax=Blepharisma stoltei TaxID=1481888 RepID=A0AAU9KEY3_9CILI|nr:unnamed protein product [Blepharisma stoltei]
MIWIPYCYQLASLFSHNTFWPLHYKCLLNPVKFLDLSENFLSYKYHQSINWDLTYESIFCLGIIQFLTACQSFHQCYNLKALQICLSKTKSLIQALGIKCHSQWL